MGNGVVNHLQCMLTRIRTNKGDRTYGFNNKPTKSMPNKNQRSRRGNILTTHRQRTQQASSHGLN